MIFDVLVLALFYMAIFGVTTLQLYAGQLSRRCAQPDFSLAYTDGTTFVVQVCVCVVEMENSNRGGLHWSFTCWCTIGSGSAAGLWLAGSAVSATFYGTAGGAQLRVVQRQGAGRHDKGCLLGLESSHMQGGI
jgi:hypothetical protein